MALDLPRDVRLQFYRTWLLLRTESAWKPAERTYAGGSLLAIECGRFLHGARETVLTSRRAARAAVVRADASAPDLFGAAVAQVPLTDMLRFHKLLAGASWIGEYGNPDVEADRAFIAKCSPYQNTRAGPKYPPLFLVTSTRDDRVHPGHARKLAARMLEQGHEVLYFENVEGGHAAGADDVQAARMWAQTLTFFARELGLGGGG